MSTVFDDPRSFKVKVSESTCLTVKAFIDEASSDARMDALV